MARARAWVGLASFVAIAWPCAARAQGAAGDVAAAEALFEAGRTAVERGEYPAACAKFRESERLDPAAGTLLNLADCEEHLGHLASAWEAWKEAVARLPLDDPRLPGARVREHAIDARVPRLTIKLAPGAPEGTTVRRDGVDMHAASFDVPLPVDPGPHAIVVVAPGRDPKSTTLTLKEHDAITLPAEPGPPTPPPTPPPTQPLSPPPTQPAPPPSSTWRTVGFLTGATGIAGVALGSLFGVLAIGKKSTVGANCIDAGCNPQGLDAAHAGHTDAIVSDVAFVAGGALLATGIVLVLTHPARPPDVVASPALLDHGGGMAVQGRF